MNAMLTEIRDFLAQYPPFDDLPPAQLDALPGKLQSRYYRRGSDLVTVGQDSTVMWIIRSGAVDLRDENGALLDRRGTGSCVGQYALIRGGPSRFTATAIEDTLALTMPEPLFHQLARSQPAFEEHFVRGLGQRMRGAAESVAVAERGEPILKTRIRDMIRRPPLSTPPTATIRDVAEKMRQEHVSSLLVMDGSRLVGIVTDSDLRNRVLAEGRDPGGQVSTIMTADPLTVPGDAMALELLLELVAKELNHLPVMDGDQVIGVVATKDLVRLQHVNPVYLVGDIIRQNSVHALAAAASRLPQSMEQLVSQDATADDIGRVVTAVGDAIERKLLTMVEAELGPPPASYCWVVLGSQARLEQGLSSDQDNALILSNDVRPEHAPYFLELATKVSEGLTACGYEPCRGGIMAVNPAYRQSLGHWQRTFAGWIHRPEPDAVLKASIFFDMRPLWGDYELFHMLQRSVLEATPTSPAFLAHLTRHATASQPPLGFFRNFVLEKEGDHRATLDLKRGGVSAVVELARVYALVTGQSAVNTHARLLATAEAGNLSHERVDDLRDAFEFISYVRLRHQGRQVRAGVTPDNHVSPDELSNVERRHLRDVFQIVRRAQSILAQSRFLHYVS